MKVQVMQYLTPEQRLEFDSKIKALAGQGKCGVRNASFKNILFSIVRKII